MTWKGRADREKGRGLVGMMESAAFPDFDCLIYASGHNIGRRLMEICMRGEKKQREINLLTFM